MSKLIREGVTIRLHAETVELLRKVEGELQAQNGHAKTHDDAIKALIELWRRAK